MDSEHLLRGFYGGPFEDKVGLGKPSENPYVTADYLYVVCMIDNGTSTRSHPAHDISLFLNIHIPPSFPKKKNFPVKVYIHGG